MQFSCSFNTESLFFECRYAFPIKCTDVVVGDDKETILEIRAEYDSSKKTKPKVTLKLSFSLGVDGLSHSFQLSLF